MLHSVRARLTLWYTAILALVLVTFSSISYVLLAQATRSATDASLSNTAHEFAAAFSNDPGEADEREGAPLLDFRYSDRDVIVFAQDGRVTASSLPRLTAGDRATIANAVKSGFNGFRTLKGGGEDDGIRVFAVPIDVVGRRYTAVVAQDLHAQAERLESAQRAVLFGIPLALIVAAGGGYALARKSLASVAAMSAKARQIGAETLDERIAVENDRDELGHLASTLNDLLERLQRAFASQRRFMADASHELRTPLSIIQGESDVALGRANRSPGEYRESLEIIRGAARRLTRIVQNLFLLARTDAGAYPMNMSRFYLDELLSDSVKAMRTVASTRQIGVECSVPSDMLIHADEELIQRMFLNLLDNAVKFTPPRGRVTVSAERSDHIYTIRVSDTGPAVPPQERALIFERFYRGDRTGRSEVGGAGLGLPIARWIATAHGGAVELEDGAREGNTFRITLPANIEAATSSRP